MPTCPHGHESATADYCDECGALMSASGPDPAPEADRIETNRSHRTEMLRGPAPPPAGEPCPACSTQRSADARFCETCGFDFLAPAVATAQPEWVAEVTADAAYYDRVAPDGVPFPGPRPASVFTLRSDEVAIGRRSESRDIHPDIDLSGELVDPGVSHRHALLVRRPDGGYNLVDAGSTNGTTMNDESAAIGPAAPVELADGDRIHVGAWTTITVRSMTTGSSS